MSINSNHSFISPVPVPFPDSGFSISPNNGAKRCPLFSTFCAAFGPNVGKNCQRAR